MKKAKILSILGIMLAMGLTACGGASSEEPAPSSSEAPVSQSTEAPSSSQEEKSSSEQQTTSEAPQPQKDQTGHIWGADADVAGDAENGLVAYKRAECTEGDKAVKYTVNQSVVTYEKGGRKSGTPDGYTKLNANGDIMSIKFNAPKYLKGKMYLYGCMDGWSSNSAKNAFSYNGNPNIEVKVNGEALDIAALKDVVYTDFLGGDTSADYSEDGYGYIGDIILVPGANYVTYKRVASMNTLVKDFVFVGEEFDSEWAEGQAVAADATAGTVAYTKFASNFSNKVKIEVKLEDSMLAEGSQNKNDPAGYMKLKSNNQSFSFKFNFDAAALGYLYQRGVMDGWGSNDSRMLFCGGSNGADDFEIKVNEEAIDLSAQKQLTFKQALPGETQEGNLSPLTDVLTGCIALKNGVNEVVFKRLASYNLALTHMVLIVEASDHVHTVATEWSHDDAFHFYACTDANCPLHGDYRKGSVRHAFAADEANPDVDATCTQKGAKHYKCECGATKTEELDLLPHTWVSDDELASTDTVSTCTTHGVAHVKCSVCGAKEAQELPLADHSWGEAQTAIGDAVPHECANCHAMCYELAVASPAKLKSDITWNVTGLPAGKYEVHLSACAASTTLTQDIVSGGSGRYQFRFGSEGDYVSPASGTYASYGLGTGEKIGNVAWTKTLCELTAAEGVASFTIHYGGQGYSAFIAAVRLVKVA